MVQWDDMRPVAPNPDTHPDRANVDAILLLIGVSHTQPGTAATVDLSGISLAQ
jgi:hypothetical protein